MTNRLIHAAYIDDIELGRVWFASLDGELYIEVADDPRDYSLGAVERAFGDEREGWTPMRMRRTFLRRVGAAFDPEP